MSFVSRVGIGFDVHRLMRGRRLILGGLEMESAVGLEGHSDGDVLLHAVTDAILGACALGDIGDHFPSHEPQWKDADSNTFLQEALSKAEEAGFEIANVDTIVVAERPHLGAWKEAIRASLAGRLDLPVERVCVKAKTNEGLGPVGEGRAIEAHAIVLLRREKPASRAKSKAKAPARKAAVRKAARRAAKAPRRAAKRG